MGLEAATYVGDLNTSNPVSGDNTSQGDDHLRLLKAVLQTTFPNADKAFRLPDAVAKTANYTVLSTDLNKIITVDATAGAATMTLPTLAAADDGWNCRFIKIDASTNGMVLAGTINGVSGLTLAVQYQFVEVHWSGTAWYATTGVVDIAALVALTAPAVGDLLAIYDLDVTTIKKITLANLFKIITSFTAETAPAIADELVLYDADAATVDKITLEILFEVINGFTEETSPDFTSDFIPFYDASATAVRKIAPKDIVNSVYWLKDEQTSGTVGATLTDVTQNTVRLNTEHVDNVGGTVSSNVIVLPAGVWEIEAEVPAHYDQGGSVSSNLGLAAQLRLRNTTGGTTLVTGKTYYNRDGNSQNVEASGHVVMPRLHGQFTVAAAQNLEVQIYVDASGSIGTITQGKAFSLGTEVYADVKFTLVG